MNCPEKIIPPALPQIMAAAPASGSGKTTAACALLRALQRRGLTPCAFKCGPDYIDPMFHRAVVGTESCNLDLYLAPPARVRALYAAHLAGHGAAVVEAAMGYYDGAALTDAASAWQVAETLGLPVLLVVRPGGASLTLAAQIRGLAAFRAGSCADSHIAAVLLNDCSPAYAGRLVPLLERETGLPVIGCLPRVEGTRLPSRHLGLYTADEVADLAQRVDALADALEANADLGRLLALCRRPAPAPPAPAAPPPVKACIAVARDRAFCFCYPESLDALRAAGAECVFFSPLADGGLPDAGGLYLPGGYPELFAEALSRNAPMRRAVAAAVAAGMPTVAECGGLLYLGQTLADEGGRPWPMAGALPGAGAKAGRLVRFGYTELEAEGDSLLFRKGERVPAHEFHHWDSTAPGAAFAARKPDGRAWRCGYAGRSLYAGFPHLYFAGRPALAERFAAAAARWEKEKETDRKEGSHAAF